MEDLLSQKCKELISSLPKERGSSVSYLYKYQGFWYIDAHLQEVISSQNHFKAQDSDVVLVTTPKSGTTWLKAILFSLINRTRYDPTLKAHPLLHNNPHDLVPFLEIMNKLYADNKIPDFSSSVSCPRLLSSHTPYVSLAESIKNNPTCKIVYLRRNPKDTFASLWHFANKMKLPEKEFTIGEFFDRFINGISLFGPYWEHVLEYWNKSTENPDKVFFLKYEDMKADPGFLLQRLAEFLGCPFSVEEEASGLVEDILKLCSFENLSSLEVNKNGKLTSGLAETKVFFRSGVVGDWTNCLDSEMVAKIDEITEQKFHGSGLMI